MYILFKVVLMSQLAWYSSGDISGVDLAAILSDMTEHCPLVDVCGNIERNRTKSTADTNACCVGCSCGNDCHNGPATCCFDNDPRTKTQEPSYATCLKPALSQRITLPSYRFITNPPIDGCKREAGFSTCYPDITVAPWGKFFPVYSKSLDTNFMNEQCAICHGADPINLEYWRSKVVFRGFSEDSFVSSMTKFYETYNSSDSVFVIFEGQSAAMTRIEKRCFEVIDTCKFEFYIPSTINLDKAMVVRGCLEGPRALYVRNETHVYKNVYCAICDQFVHQRTDEIMCSHIYRDRSDLTSLTFLMDLETSFLNSTRPKDVVKTDTCFRHKDHLNGSRCVQPYCPALQIRMTSGICQYPPGKIKTKCLSVVLSLSTAQAIDKSWIYNLTRVERLAIFQEQNSWPSNWTIGIVFDTAYRETTEFHVGISFKTRRSFSLQQLTLGIQRNLSKRWSIRIGGDTVSFQQGFLSHFNTDPMIMYNDNNGFGRFCPLITKMYYCQQIELRPDEYEHDEENVVRLTHSDRALYRNEYTVFNAEDGSEKVRVCLEDSGYIKVDTASIGTRTSVEATYILQVVLTHSALVLVV